MVNVGLFASVESEKRRDLHLYRDEKTFSISDLSDACKLVFE